MSDDPNNIDRRLRALEQRVFPEGFHVPELINAELHGQLVMLQAQHALVCTKVEEQRIGLLCARLALNGCADEGIRRIGQKRYEIWATKFDGFSDEQCIKLFGQAEIDAYNRWRSGLTPSPEQNTKTP